MGSSSPQVPVYDPAKVAFQQQQSNEFAGQAAQAASMVGQETPFGSLKYEQTGVDPNTGMPTYTATTTYSPAQQELINQLQSSQLEAGRQAGKFLGNVNTNPEQAIGDMTSGIMGRQVANEIGYLNPFFTPQRDQLDAKLRNQGLDPSSRAYQTAMNNLIQSQNQTFTGFLTQVEPQAFNQAQTIYGMPLAMAQTELGLSTPAALTQQFVNTPGATVAPTNVVGAYNTAQQAQIAQQQAEMQKNAALMGGLFGTGAAVLGGWARSPSGGSYITNLLPGSTPA